MYLDAPGEASRPADLALAALGASRHPPEWIPPDYFGHKNHRGCGGTETLAHVLRRSSLEYYSEEYTMTSASQKASSQQDAISLLVSDHKEVKTLFKQFEDLSDRSKVSKKKIADQICAALILHTRIEEQIFYPAVREAIKDDDLMDEAVVEHASAKDLISQIQEMDPGDDLYDAKVKVLSEQIDHHVEEEEKEMFPKVRKAKLDLVALGEQMADTKEVAAEGVTA
jgi:hemerythrin superfamily protein